MLPILIKTLQTFSFPLSGLVIWEKNAHLLHILHILYAYTIYIVCVQATRVFQEISPTFEEKLKMCRKGAAQFYYFYRFGGQLNVGKIGCVSRHSKEDVIGCFIHFFKSASQN